VRILWWILIILFLAAPARASGTDVRIDVVNLSITPNQLPCDGTSTFTATVTARGWSDDGVSRNCEIRLFDVGLFPDELDKEPKGTATIGTVFPSPLPVNPPYTWTLSITITSLFCTQDCEVTGPSGNSCESDLKIFAYLKVLHGSPFPAKRSNKVPIKCVTSVPTD
jgi:hypothetical protein